MFRFWGVKNRKRGDYTNRKRENGEGRQINEKSGRMYWSSGEEKMEI